MKKWKFEVTIPEGYDEFFDSLSEDKDAEVKELHDMLERMFAQYGFFKDYGLKIKFKKRIEK
jgi:hypothetical protein